MANIFKKRARQLVIEGSRHHKRYNRWMKAMLYLGGPFLILLVVSTFIWPSTAKVDNPWIQLSVLLMGLGGMLVAYFWDKGYRHRDKITEEDYASLGYKAMSASQLGWCIVIGVAVTNLNKYYLHWF